jgi:hypothetical protein
MSSGVTPELIRRLGLDLRLCVLWLIASRVEELTRAEIEARGKARFAAAARS